MNFRACGDDEEGCREYLVTQATIERRRPGWQNNSDILNWLPRQQVLRSEGLNQDQVLAVLQL